MVRAMGEPKRRATYEDLMQVPDTKVAEIIDGELVVSPRPASPHAHAATVLGADFVDPFHGEPDDPRGLEGGGSFSGRRRYDLADPIGWPPLAGVGRTA
jgi:hypothetical protein